MGALLSKKVEKRSKDVLEDLEKEILAKTRSRQRNQQYERSFVSYLLLLSFGLYLVGLAVLYLYFRPSLWWEWLGYLAPLVLFPLVVYMVKKLLNLYFLNRKTQFDQELATLHEEKRRVLNEVMEKENYKTAVELLERYEPTHPALQHKATPTSSPANDRGDKGDRGGGKRSELRRRAPPHTPRPHPSQLHQSTPLVAAAMPPQVQATPTPMAQYNRAAVAQYNRAAVATPSRAVDPPSTPSASGNGNTAQPFIPPGMCLGAPPGPPTPCPILPRDRSKVDKVVEYLVGDGPNNRYALICQECHSHNGMALRDEFEYISFRCAYCFHLNQARKKKSSSSFPTRATDLPDLKPASSKNDPTKSEDVVQRKPSRKRTLDAKEEQVENNL